MKPTNSVVVIEVKGHQPFSFKNRKRVVMSRRGQKLMLITDPKVKPRMKALENAIVSELISGFLTTCIGTSMVCSLQRWIATVLPFDDCWQEMPEITATCQLVPKGQEGVRIEITEI